MARAPLAPVPVTFVSSHALGGGSERYLELLLGELGPDWVRGLVSLADGPFVGRMREGGWPVEVVPTPARLGMLPAAARLRRVLRTQRPAVIHANGVKAALATSLAATGSGVPVLWLKHDYSWDGPLARVLALRCAAVVAVSEGVTATFGERLRERVSVVPNGIPDLSRDRRAARSRLVEALRCPPDAPLAALVGRLHRAKGQLELIEAAPRLLELRPGARLALIGGEDPTQLDYAHLLRRRVEELGLREAITFLGHRQDVLDLIAGCDAAVVPSVQDERGAGREGCPYALLEAMSLGTPVVGYADGGIPEALGDSGVLVPPGDRAALADRLAGLLGDAGLRKRLAESARERVLSRNRLDAMADAMGERYQVLAGD